MTGIQRFDNAMRQRSQRQPKKNPIFSGYLGIHTGGEDVVKIPSRLGFVWVRLRNVNNEVIQAFNEDVSPIMNLPVRVERDLSSPTRYKVIGRDIDVYGSNWGTASPYIGPHAGQHSFNKADTSTGGDIVWIYPDQFLPLLVTPSGSAGSNSVIVFPGVYHHGDGTYHYAGNTGTSSVLGNLPTGAANARMSLIYLDTPSGNPKILANTDEFSNALTGTAQVLQYIPAVPYDNDIALAGVRLVTGTSVIGWNNLYDIREHVHKRPVPEVKKYLTIPAGSFRLGTSAPDRGTQGTFATLLFANNVTEEAYYNLHIPKDWATGTNMELAVYWTPTDGTSGTVAWEFDWEAVASEANEVLGAGSTHVDIHDHTQRLDNELLETPYGVIAGASLSPDDTVGIKFYRDHDDASDNYGADAALIHVEIEYYSVLRGEKY